MSDLICERCFIKDCECVPYDVECDSCIRAYKQGRADDGIQRCDWYLNDSKEEGTE